MTHKVNLGRLPAFVLGAFSALLCAPVMASQPPPTYKQPQETVDETAQWEVPDGIAFNTQMQGLQPLSLGGSLVEETEPNDSPATATPLPGAAARVRGSIWPVADVDYFSFSGSAGDRIYAATQTSFAAGVTDTTLTLFDSDGTTVIEVDVNDGSFAASSSSIAGAVLPADGTYYLQVRATSAVSTMRPYDLYFQRRSGSPTAEAEPNNLADGGQPMPATSWVAGAINPAGDNDVFVFALNAGDTVFLSLDLDPERDGGASWNGRLGLGPFGDPALILIVNDANTTSPNSEAFFFTVKESGTYYAYIDPATAGTGDPTFTYHLSATVFPASPATASCTTYSSSDTPIVIPDGPGLVTSSITVPGNPRIADLDVSIELTHANMPDLDVVLQAPGGNEVVLFNDLGTNTQQTMNLRLDDEAALPMGSYTVMSGMAYQPPATRRLDWFDGQDAGGVWTLQVYDDLAANGGNLSAWSLTICEPPPPPICPLGTQQVTVFEADFNADDGGFTSSGAQNEWQWGAPSFAPITSCATGSNCWVTDLTGTYNNSSNQTLTSPVIDLSGLVGPVQLHWSQKHQIENANWDNASVRVQEAGGANPTALWEWTGPTMSNQTVGSPTVTVLQSAGWARRSADISAYAGQSIEATFQLSSDTTVNFAGLAIDDVVVTACEEVPGIELRMTVGTTPGVCAVTDSVTITAGEQVFYCYQAENLGPLAFNFHTLTDSESGDILSGFPFVLGPGGISPEVIVPATPAATVTSTAVWTAATALGSYQADDTIAFDWQDISGTGSLIPLGDDSVSAQIPAGFSFTFYGETYSGVHVSSNGFLTVLPGQPNGCCTGGILPSATTPNGVIAGWWEDLNPGAGGSIHHQTLSVEPNRVFIVQFTDVPHFGGGNLVSKQYKIFEGSNIIEVHYLAAPSDGGTHSAGIENADGTEGIQYYRGTEGLTTPLAVRYAIATLIEAQDTAQATVTVLIPDIDVNPLALNATQDGNSITSQALTITNVGQGVLTWSIAEEPAARAPESGLPQGSSAPASARELASLADAKTPAVDSSPQLAAPMGAPANVLWDNGPFITSAGGGAGGADVSVLQQGLGLDVFGFGHQVSTGSRVADDFEVTGTWLIENVVLYAYQTGSSTTSTITEVNLRIWDGPPGEAGSNVVFGDTTTNRLVSTGWSGVYRTLESTPADTSRPIMASIVAVNTLLGPGTYWLDWQARGTLASGPWAPPISILGQATTGNARQFTDAWANLVDGAFPQGLPFLITGLDDCSSPEDVPWLSLGSSAGALSGGQSAQVDVYFDSTGLESGIHEARLCISSNDPDTGPGNGTQLVVVPVELNVTPTPAIELAVTVGTQPGVCAGSASIFVDAGTTVYYCYEVTNTGNVTLNLHDLVDNQLGPVFSGLNYALTPGSSVNTVAAGLSIPVVITASVGNTATWTGYNAGPSDVVTAQASANVTLAEPAITLEKTVGTDPTACADSSAIMVEPGTEVTYCYTVTNTGNVTLNLHDLEDDQLGTLLAGFSFALTPGSSVFFLETTTASNSVVNTAIWDAYNPGPVNVASDQDSATVIVSDLIFEDGFEDTP